MCVSKRRVFRRLSFTHNDCQFANLTQEKFEELSKKYGFGASPRFWVLDILVRLFQELHLANGEGFIAKLHGCWPWYSNPKPRWCGSDAWGPRRFQQKDAALWFFHHEVFVGVEVEDCWIFVGDKRHANWVLGIPTAPLNSLGPSKDFPDPDGYPSEETLMKILDRLFWQNQTKITCQCLLSVILQWVTSIFAGAKRCCPQILLPILCPQNLKFIRIQQIVLKLGIVSELQTMFGSCADFPVFVGHIVSCCQNLPKLADTLRCFEMNTGATLSSTSMSSWAT